MRDLRVRIGRDADMFDERLPYAITHSKGPASDATLEAVWSQDEIGWTPQGTAAQSPGEGAR